MSPALPGFKNRSNKILIQVAETIVLQHAEQLTGLASHWSEFPFTISSVA